MASSSRSYPPPPPSSASSPSPSRSQFSAYSDSADDDDEGSLALRSSASPRARRRPPTLVERFVPPALRKAASRRGLPQASQLVSSRAATYSVVIFTVIALGCLALQLAPNVGGRWSSNGGGADALPSSSAAHAILYKPNPAEGVCAFLDPTLGFPSAEHKLIDRLRSTVAGAKDGTPRWLDGRKLDLNPAGSDSTASEKGDYLGLTAAVEDTPHPLLGLVVRGEQKFRRMVGRRSGSLKEAVGEYKRRYGRRPPRGFDRWWDYATKHTVLLPDEYDSIWDSLAPFMGLTHAEFTRRLALAKAIRGTVMLEIRSGAARAVYTEGLSESGYWEHRRSDGQLELIEPVVGELPDLTIVFGLMDEPQVLLDWESRQALLNASFKHEQLSTLPDSPPTSRPLWPASCPIDSPLRRGSPPSGSPHREFISPTSHRLAQNPCLHPELADQHGFLIGEKGEWTNPQIRFGPDLFVPVLAMSKVEGMADIGGIPFDKIDFEKEHVDSLAWGKKKSEKLYWRGHSTGGTKDRDHGHRWRSGHRTRLHQKLNDPSPRKSLPVLVVDDDGETETRYVAPADLRNWAYDVKLAGEPLQCNSTDGTCDEMSKVLTFAPEDGQAVADNAKYLYDIDGNAWTSRFRRLMSTNSLVLKSTIFPEWNTDILPEWFAYVPMKIDYTDIATVMSFFRGPPGAKKSGKGLRDEVARRMAHNSRCWVQRTWRKEDLIAYQYRLLLEYARIESGGAWGDFDDSSL